MIKGFAGQHQHQDIMLDCAGGIDSNKYGVVADYLYK
jgi:hypothetical protein